ncbi:MAG TPA: NUDIX hydrolase [Pseudolabrys sp.]|nr:NUDIX hydrolase [Pseudolabrys sp.]
MEAPTVVALDRLDLTFDPQPWPFAIEKRGEIDAYFEALKREKPALWNGRVLLMHRHAVEDGVLRGRYLETDFASFTAWRAWGRPPTGAYDCFGAAAIVAADGAVLVGVMGAHTANAGRIYFPCGTPDPSDIHGGKVDLDFSVRRELQEETGFEAGDFDVAPGWTMVVDGTLIAQIKTLRSRDSADTLRARALVHLASEQHPELADIRIVRGPGDFDPAMPRFVTAFLRDHFGGR